jgi:hypothetical protein
MTVHFKEADKFCPYEGCTYKTARISCYQAHIKRVHLKWKGEWEGGGTFALGLRGVKKGTTCLPGGFGVVLRFGFWSDTVV